MAFRSKLCSIVTALTLSSTPLAKAQENFSKPKTYQEKHKLDLILHQLPLEPKVDLNTLNRCPAPYIEVATPPKILDILSSDHPAYLLILDLFAGEKSLDPKYDDLRLVMLDSPKCTLPFEDLPTKKEIPTTKYHGPKHTAGNRNFAKIELPGTGNRALRYRLFGKDNQRITNGDGGIEVDINDADIYFNEKRYQGPRLSLTNLFIGDSTLPNFLNNWEQFPAIKKELENDLENLVNNVSGTLENREIEIFIDWGSFFRETLPKYFNENGLITDVDALRQEVKDKAEEFYKTKLNESEQQSIDAAITNFENELNNLQHRNSLAKTALGVITADDPFCTIKWGGVPFCEAFRMLESLGPELVEIKRDDGILDVKIKDLNASLYTFSANSHTIYDLKGSSITLSDYSRIRLQAIGGGFFRGELTEGENAENYIPEKFKDEIGLLESILGRPLNIVDGRFDAQLWYNLAFSNERMHGQRIAFNLGDKHRFGIIKNNGFEYQLNSRGYAGFTGLANSKNNLLLGEFQGSLLIEQLLRSREELGLDLIGISDNLWYNTNFLLRQENIVKRTEVWGASWRYRANYSGNEQQNAYSIFTGKDINRWNQFSVENTARAGINVNDNLELNFLIGRKEKGLGFFVNYPQINIDGSCSEVKCMIRTKLPLLGTLNPERSREHHIRTLQVEDSMLVGKESLQQEEEYYYNLSLLNDLPGTKLFFDVSYKHFLQSKFPYWNENSVELGLTLIGNIDDTTAYAKAMYLGNFVNKHGGSLDLGTEKLFLKLTYAHETNEIRRTNSTTAGLETTLDLGSVRLVQMLELYPSANDANPHYEKSENGFKEVSKGDFQFLGKVRGEGDVLEDLIRAIIEGKSDHMQLNTLSIFRKNPGNDIAVKGRFSYILGNVNTHHELLLSYDSDKKKTLNYKSDIIFNALHGLGPAIVTKVGNSLVDKRLRMLPGIGYSQDFGPHHLRSTLTAWDNEGVVTDIRTRYLYDNQDQPSSFYLRSEASSYLIFGLKDNEKIDAKEIKTSLYLGGRQNSFIITGYGEYDIDKGIGGGLMIGLDLTKF